MVLLRHHSLLATAGLCLIIVISLSWYPYTVYYTGDILSIYNTSIILGIKPFNCYYGGSLVNRLLNSIHDWVEQGVFSQSSNSSFSSL